MLVALVGPPLVIKSIKPKLLNDSIKVMIETKNKVGEIDGMVMWKNWNLDEAPSILAASYNVVGTEVIAPSRIRKVKPKFIHTVVTITAHIAAVGSVNQGICGKCSHVLANDKNPVDGLKMNSQKIAATETETPIVAENSVRKMPIPGSRLLARFARTRPSAIVIIVTANT